MKLLVPAKVNLHLRILGRRGDGYHEIQTLLVRVGLYDELEISLGGNGLRLILEGEKIPSAGDNLILRAARAFFQDLGRPEDARIRLIKKIPIAAGLGGGSSDAASTLMGLNELLGAPLRRDRLMDLGSRIGADVPFFIFEKPAVARGIGEKLSEVLLPESLWFFLLIPPFGISTAWAYEAYDHLPPPPLDPIEIPGDLRGIEDLEPILRNDLERLAFARFPEIRQMKERLLSAGAKGALMSGSGPVVFGIFQTQEEVEKASQAISLLPGWKGLAACRL